MTPREHAARGAGHPLRLWWTARSTNYKTGNVPTAWVGTESGAIRDGAAASCAAAGCALLGAGCYAWAGNVRTGAASVERAIAAGKPRSLEWALARRHRRARMVRVTALGDLSAVVADTLAAAAAARALGLAVVGYTHHAQPDPRLRPVARRSVDRVADVDAAIGDGWSVAVVSPLGSSGTLRTAGGVDVPQCPATRPDAKITCNACRLCEVGPNRPRAVHFPAHGSEARAADVIARATGEVV